MKPHIFKNRFARMRRSIRFWWQRKTRGWSDEETWNLEQTIAAFILPRLKRFREITNGFPGELSEKKWNEILDEMIWTFAFLASDEIYCCEDKGKWKRVNAGLLLFARWFVHLWW